MDPPSKRSGAYQIYGNEMDKKAVDFYLWK